jgi:hypothetical protein
MKRQFLILLSLLPVVTACATDPSKPAESAGEVKNFTVMINPAAQGATLEISSASQGCTQREPKNGCVQFEPNDVGTVTLKLAGEREGTGCNTVPAATWVLTQVRLSDTGIEQTEKGKFGGEQAPWLVRAFPGVNGENGVYYEKTAEKGKVSVTLIDLNNHPTKEGVKTAYYEVTATHCASLKSSVTDPAIRNTGKGSGR